MAVTMVGTMAVTMAVTMVGTIAVTMAVTKCWQGGEGEQERGEWRVSN